MFRDIVVELNNCDLEKILFVLPQSRQPDPTLRGQISAVLRVCLGIAFRIRHGGVSLNLPKSSLGNCA